MARRCTSALLGLLALVLLPGCLGAAEVVIVLSADLPPYLEAAEGVQESLSRLTDAEVVQVSLDGRQERWEAVAERIAQVDPSVVVPVGSLATALAARRIQDRNLVYTMILNPDSLLAGLRPGRRVTGVAMNVDPLDVFRGVREAFPRARRVGVLYDPDRSAQIVAEAGRAASATGLVLEAVAVRDARELPSAVQELASRDIDVLWLFVDRTVLRSQEGLELIMLETLREGVPIVAPSDRYVKAGALMSLGVDYRALGVQTGELVRDVLASETLYPQPERPRNLVISVNEKVREALGLELPASFHDRVDRTIE